MNASAADTAAARRGVWVDPARIATRSERLGGLPVVNAVLERLGFVDLVASYLDEPDVRCVLPTDQVIGVLVRNLALGRQPLYGLGAWAAGWDHALLGLAAGEVGALNDDRVGRALDELFCADRASLTTALGLAAVRAYDIDCAPGTRWWRCSDEPTSSTSPTRSWPRAMRWSTSTTTTDGS